MNLINLQGNNLIGYEIVYKKEYKAYFLNMDFIVKTQRKDYETYTTLHRVSYFITSVKRQSQKQFNACLEMVLNNMHIFKNDFLNDLKVNGFYNE